MRQGALVGPTRATGPTKSSVGEPLLPRARGGTGDGDTSSAVRLSVCPHATDAATHSLSLSVAPSRSIYVHSIHPESMQCPMVNTGQTSEAQPPLLLYPLRVNTTKQASRRRHCCRGHWRQWRRRRTWHPLISTPRTRAEATCVFVLSVLGGLKWICRLIPSMLQK